MNKRYTNISYTVRQHCAVCERKLTKPVISLPRLPLTEIYTTKKPGKLTGFANQYFHFCPRCKHGQISRILDPQILYSHSSYFFRTSRSASAKAANYKFIQFISQTFQNHRFKTVIEFGCSDLYLLTAFKSKAQQLIGIDPILKGKEKQLSTANTLVIGKGIEEVDFSSLNIKGSTMIISSHTLEHISDPNGTLASLFNQVREDTVFVFQFPGLEGLVANNRFDQIFHQHLHYFSRSSFAYLVSQLGGEILAYETNHQHWHAHMIAFRMGGKQKRKYKHRMPTNRFSTRQIKEKFLQYKQNMKLVNQQLQDMENEITYGYGASLMLPVLNYHLPAVGKLEKFIDDDRQKAGKYYINLIPPIALPKQNYNYQNTNIVITAPDAIRSILPKVILLKPKRIILPINII